MPYNHRLENQDLRPTTRQDDRTQEELSEQDLDAVSGGNDLGQWNLHVDDMTIGGKNWVEQFGDPSPVENSLAVDPNTDTSGPLVTDPTPPPNPR